MKMVLITGATSGIGFELAKQCAAAGYDVIATGRNKDRLDSVAALGDKIFPLTFDVSDVDRISDWISHIFASYPKLDCIINNAGVQDNVRVDEDGYSIDDIEQEIRINLTAPIEISRAALPFLVKKDNARIVNVSSGLAYMPKLTSAVYSATKAGLHLFTDGLAVQMKDSSVSLSEVILPIVATPMTEGRGSGKISAHDAAKQIIEGIEKGHAKIYVGKAKALPFLLRFLPFIAKRILQK